MFNSCSLKTQMQISQFQFLAGTESQNAADLTVHCFWLQSHQLKKIFESKPLGIIYLLFCDEKVHEPFCITARSNESL